MGGDGFVARVRILFKVKGRVKIGLWLESGLGFIMVWSRFSVRVTILCG